MEVSRSSYLYNGKTTYWDGSQVSLRPTIIVMRLMTLNLHWDHDDVIKWNLHFPRYWPFERGIHRSPVNAPHKSLWRGALMFPLICAWISGWVNNRDAGDLRRHRAHYDASVMYGMWLPHTINTSPVRWKNHPATWSVILPVPRGYKQQALATWAIRRDDYYHVLSKEQSSIKLVQVIMIFVKQKYTTYWGMSPIKGWYVLFISQCVRCLPYFTYQCCDSVTLATGSTCQFRRIRVWMNWWTTLLIFTLS